MSRDESKDSMVKQNERKSSIKSMKDNKAKQDRIRSLRILIVEPKGKYCRIVWCAIGLGITHVLIGATVMAMLIYSIKKGDPHISICTIAVCEDNSIKTEIDSYNLKRKFEIIDPGGQYWEIIFWYCLVGIVQLFIGATLAIMSLYPVKNTADLHVACCTFAYHFFSAEAILSLNYANGWSSPFRLRHRRFTHVFLQMCGLACAITGTALITIDKGISDSVHGITGIVTTVMAVITFLSGPCALFGGRYLKILHMSFGMPTFLMSSVCLCFGAFTPGFRSWAGSPVAFVIVCFVIFYTSYIVITCFMKCIMRI